MFLGIVFTSRKPSIENCSIHLVQLRSGLGRIGLNRDCNLLFTVKHPALVIHAALLRVRVDLKGRTHIIK